MDPSDAFTASLYKWDPTRPNGVVIPQPPPQVVAGYSMVRPREMGELEEMFGAYGVRYYTAAKIAELGFTVSTLVDMREEELDDMMNSLTQIFRWELMVGERYGIKAAVRAERRRLDDEDLQRRNLLLGPNIAATANGALDALSQEAGLSEEPVQQEKEAAGSGGGTRGIWEVAAAGATGGNRLKQVRKKGQRKMSAREDEENDDDIEEGICDRQREHPFIVTEPGEVARGKKNGLDRSCD